MPPSPTQRMIFRSWAHEVLEIKELFHIRKYKRCAARCEELFITAVHPLHQTFLHFYHALCYESLGMAAHVYSAKKLSLLDLARDSFGFALECLPLPFEGIGTVRGNIGSPTLQSPDCVTLNIVKRYQYPSPLPGSSNTVSPTDSGFSCSQTDDSGDGKSGEGLRQRSHSVSSTSTTSTMEDRTKNMEQARILFNRKTSALTRTQSKVHLTTPIFTGSDQPPFPGSNTSLDLLKQHSTPAMTSSSTHKARLSQSLSSTHCIADELVPSPLFNRTHQRSKAHISPMTATTPSPVLTRQPSLHSHPNNSQPAINNEDKPLPPLPFNHEPTFLRRGSRHILIPKHPTIKPRASAIQTLVAKFEGKIHAAATSPNSRPSTSTSTGTPSTPITPRFQAIGGILAPKQDTNPNHNEDTDMNTPTQQQRSKQDPTAIPSTLSPLTTATSSSHIDTDPHPSNSNLISRTALQTHLASVTRQIDTVSRMQAEHRAKGVNREMSFWSFRPVLAGGSEVDGDRGDGVGKRRRWRGQGEEIGS